MVEDALDLADGAVLSADICIIGGGAAGITLAHELIGSGKTVLVLEGSTLDNRQPLPADHHETLQRMETHPQTEAGTYDICDEHRFCDPIAQTLYEGRVSPEMAAIDPNFLTRSRIRVYGGTTNCWGGWTRTLAPADFDRRDLDPMMVWPVSRAELEPWYQRAIYYCSLPSTLLPTRYDQADWWPGVADQPIRPLTPSANVETAVWTVMNGQGPATPDGALDFQIVWGPALQRDPNTHVLRNANVRRIETQLGIVTQVTGNAIDYTTGRPGPAFTVQARQFVLAMGGIETVRLLLLSNLADRYGTLGRYFMVHPLNVSALRFAGGGRPVPEVMNFYAWPWAKWRNMQYPPGIFAALTPTGAALKANRIGNLRALVGFDGFGGGTLNLNWEQVPSAVNQVALSADPTRVDLFGDRRVDLQWSHTAQDQRTLELGAKLVVNELERLGLLGTVTSTDLRVAQAGDHHMGATRMSADPSTGYVDPNCRVHGLQNLFISSSSVFPTGGYANPTLTIVALAARLARHLGAREAPAEAPAEQPAVVAEE
ncbi:MAG TPA: GMC family oxidoreductase [Longimicrobium sp.]